MDGGEDREIAPKAVVSRAELAVVMMRFDMLVRDAELNGRAF